MTLGACRAVRSAPPSAGGAFRFVCDCVASRGGVVALRNGHSTVLSGAAGDLLARMLRAFSFSLRAGPSKGDVEVDGVVGGRGRSFALFVPKRLILEFVRLRACVESGSLRGQAKGSSIGPLSNNYFVSALLATCSCVNKPRDVASTGRQGSPTWIVGFSTAFFATCANLRPTLRRQ